MSVIKAIKKRDPAIRSWLEVLLYPALWCMFFHRQAHFLYRIRLYFLARLLSQWSRFLTGIEIHPGARIGRGFFVDHGMGVVIGETCEIGDNVLIYHGVTLGATTSDKGSRHPIVGNDVIIGAGATVLGRVHIGNGAKVGAGALVLKDIPECGTIVGEPGRFVSEASTRRELEELKKRVAELKGLVDS